MHSNIDQLEEHLAPRVLVCSSLLVPALVGRVHHTQHQILKLCLSQLLLVTLQSGHRLPHGAQTFGNVVIDLRNKRLSQPHRGQLLIKQDDVVVLVYFHSSQQNLRSTEKKTNPLLQ